jgi:hypothetical protein
MKMKRSPENRSARFFLGVCQQTIAFAVTPLPGDLRAITPKQ